MLFVKFLEEGHPVDRAWAVFEQCLIVRLSLVALVLFKAVLRVLLGELAHQAVSRYLGDDGRCRNRRDFCIAGDHALVRLLESLRAIAVHIDKSAGRVRPSTACFIAR